jgi:predicted amidophosphoribosyltransferase
VGGHYLKCTSAAGCKTWWPTDSEYKAPALGFCKECKGPLRSTRDCGPVCAKCGKYVQKKK